MPHISYIPDDQTVEVEEGENILTASKLADIPHTHVCGGAARCSTCRVMVLEGIENCSAPIGAETAIHEQLSFPPEIRLACQTQVFGDVKIRRLIIDHEDIEEISDQIRGRVYPQALGQEKYAAILFADIRDFTTLSEKLLPYDVVYILNRYFRQMGQVVEHYNGVINNYMGDGFIALFGTHDSQATVQQAVQAGLEMLKELETLNSHLEMLYHHRLRMGIGIHYGSVVIGEVGARDDRRMTTIGDAVNLAARIEAANKQLGTTLLVSESVYQPLSQQVQVGKVANVILKGKTGEYKLFEIQGFSVPTPAAIQPNALFTTSPVQPMGLWRKILRWLSVFRRQLRQLFQRL
jgi:adenylate cyclase